MIEFYVLDESHVESLLEFETRNREWFESLIAPRDASFYDQAGIQQHIHALVEGMSLGHSASWVALESGELVARANLKNVCQKTRTAEVGYRVGKSSTGKGVGSACVAQLIRYASAETGIAELFGYVLGNNPASRRILEKHGFCETPAYNSTYEIQGVVYPLSKLRLELE
ncbi:MAG: GNAT family N-acetyltransferase [Planctomycetota bacterium]